MSVNQSDVKLRNIVVFSLYSECGSSFITMNLAHILGKTGLNVSVVEHPENVPVMFEYLYADKKVPAGWTPLIKTLSAGRSMGKDNLWRYADVDWYTLGNDFEVDTVPPDLFPTLYMSVDRSDITLIDASVHWQSPRLKVLLDTCSEIWMVFKPNPAKIVPFSVMAVKSLAPWANKVRLIGNCWSEPANKSAYINDMTSLLKFNPKNKLVALPSFSQSDTTESEWLGKLLLENKFDEYNQAFNPLTELVLSRVSFKSSGSGFWSKFKKSR